jgi:long-chain acyl-CoA synthetase
LSSAANLGGTEGQLERPWLLHWPKDVPKHIDYPDSTISQLLDEMARQRPDAVQFIFYGRKVTFAETAIQSKRVAKALVDFGVKKGDRVALMMPNCPQFAYVYFGINRLGAAVVPVNPLYMAREVNSVLSDSQAQVIFTLDMFYAAVREGVKGTAVRHVVVSKISDYMPGAIALLGRLLGKVPSGKVPASDKALWLKDIIRNDGNLAPVSLNPSVDPAVFMYTGGTTGEPKAAVLTNRNLVSNSMMVQRWSMMGPKDVVLNVLPWFHVYGLSVGLDSTVTAGNQAIVLPKFSTEDVFQAIKKYQPTYYPGVFSMYIALLSSPHLDKYKESMKSIKFCISGAAPLPVEVAKLWAGATGGIIVEGYGLSEASPVTHVNPMDEPGHIKYGSIGIPITDTDAKIMDLETGKKQLAVGEVGELVVNGPQVAAGYWKRVEETSSTFRDGWLYTGDIAYMDKDGYFFIVDRKKDMINVGGLKVWPREIEEVAYQHPAVKLAAAIGVSDNFYGEVPKLFVVLKDGFKGKVQGSEIRDFIKEKLTKHKIPREVELKDELPTTLVGKIVRRKLRDQ